MIPFDGSVLSPVCHRLAFTQSNNCRVRKTERMGGRTKHANFFGPQYSTHNNRVVLKNVIKMSRDCFRLHWFEKWRVKRMSSCGTWLPRV